MHSDMIHWTLFVLLFVFTSGNENEASRTFSKIDFLKRKHTIQKFERQLISMLSVPPAQAQVESARHKWLDMPSIVRKRLLASNRIRERMGHKTSDFFVPVLRVENCTTMNDTRSNMCVKFKLDQSIPYSSISSTFLYLDLPRPPNSSSSYSIKSTSSNGTLQFAHQDGSLLQVNLDEFISQNASQTSHNPSEFLVMCAGECGSGTLDDAELYLEIIMRSKSNTIRNKRSVDDSQRICADDELMCCKRSFTFRPVDIGWNWIVDPEEITLNYCLGECNDQTSNYSYSKFFSILKKSKNSNLTPQQLESLRFCCAPKKYSPLEVIYLTNTNDSFQKVQLSNMIVDSCACI